MAQGHVREPIRRALGKIFFAYATVVGAQKATAQIECGTGDALARFGGNPLNDLDSRCRDSAEKAVVGGLDPRRHG
jgi:hypothetical protein